MSLSEAKSLAAVRLNVRRFEPESDRRALQSLAERCELFSPLVGLENADHPECILLDITGLAHLFVSEERLAAKVQKCFEVCGLVVRLAIANSIGLAWAVAHCWHLLPNPQQSRALVTNGDPALVARLPIAALRLPTETAKLLADLGLQQVEQLQALPRDSLLARFGPQLALRLDQLTGHSAEVIVSCKPTLPFEVEKSLEEPIRHRFLIVKVISRLLAELTGRLKDQDRGVMQLLCKFTLFNRQVISLPVFLFQPSTDASNIMELVELNLERLTLPGEVITIGVSAPITGALVREQRELFSTEKSTDVHHLALLVNRLSSRLGSDKVLFPRFRGSNLPERIRDYAPATNTQRNRSRFRGKPARDRLRPLILYQRPLPIKTISVAPDGPPQVIWLSGNQEQIISACGAERIETGWWRGASAQRDYYRIETETGSRWWMFRRLSDGQWFVHGEYA